eukprot:15003580-Ditylum_brightwellii.AAC.1
MRSATVSCRRMRPSLFVLLQDALGLRRGPCGSSRKPCMVYGDRLFTGFVAFLLLFMLLAYVLVPMLHVYSMGPSYPALHPSTLASTLMILYTSLHQMLLNMNLSASWLPRGCWLISYRRYIGFLASSFSGPVKLMGLFKFTFPNSPLLLPLSHL